MRKKFSPLTSSCLVRLNEMIRVRENEGEPFDSYEGQRLFTAHEVAWVVGASVSSVANFVKEGRLKCLTFPKSVYFTEQHVLKFIGASAVYETA